LRSKKSAPARTLPGLKVQGFLAENLPDFGGAAHRSCVSP